LLRHLTIGRNDEARQMFEAILGCRNESGILSEDIHRQIGELWNNFPREDSIVGIISAVTRLSSTEREA
jgi:GH15 family glucan-1,4-alpha-glucosidase